ncbi:MAG: oligopeptide transporter, OPT family [Acidobacteria bacterium]|nr:oligopeptide transporter, OPT family [Acidobacteriota bacterium]
MTQPDTAVRELTVKSVALGLFLAFVFGSANAYLGMKAGQTVAATIPAAVIAMALFRIPALRGGLLEQNIARTAGSVGEALVAGAIFTLPAFLLVEIDGQRLWADLRGHYWQGVVILLAGGLAGVFFIILLRRALCVDAQLPWPESVASYEIVKAGQESGDAPRLVFGGMAFGGLIQVLKSDKGLQVFREYTEGFLEFPRSVVRHFDFAKQSIGTVAHSGGIPWSTPALSPALIGIGYIIGPKYASINVAGGLLAWWVLIPLMLFIDPDLGRRIGGAGHDVAAYTLWFNVVRPIAVGMMLVGAANTMFSMRKSIGESLSGAFRASTRASHAAGVERTERDIPTKWVLASIAALMLPVAAIYYGFTGSLGTAIATAFIMGGTGFLLSAVGGYLVGLVGSSNQPLSGLTLSALVISALLMQAMGVKGAAGVAAVLGVAAVVAVAVSVSGSLIQDLKAGHLLGGTPWKMQVVEILAVVLLSLFLMGPIIALHEANLSTGGIGGRALPAPQAGLMAQLAKGIVGGDMAWGLLMIGAAFGVALLLCGAKAMMLIAVGMYLPFDTSSAIFLGGLVKWVVEKLLGRHGDAARLRADEAGTLLASGLIAGEAVVGILLAVLFLSGVSSITHVLTGADAFSWYPALGGWLALGAFAALGWALIGVPLKRARQ